MLVACASVAFLAAGSRLTPNDSGIGTHTQLGLGDCAAPRVWGIPCPTCGITTAFVHAARGHVLTALIVQPVGFLLAVGIAATTIASAVTVVTGRRWVVNWWRVSPLWLALAVVAVVLLAWVYKIATYQV